MRFKSKIHDVGLFLRLITAVQKISSVAVMQLSPVKILFIVVNDVTDGFQVWSGLNQTSLFSEYLIESLNKNVISLEIDLEKLLKALKSGHSAQYMVMKLIRKEGGAFLSFIADTNQLQSVLIQQDVPVNVMTQQQLLNLSEPVLPEPDVYIMMPSLKLLRPIVEHMKNISQYLYVTANMSGSFTLKVETEMFTITTFFRNLEHPYIEGAPPPSIQAEKVSTVKVDIKKFHKTLYSYQVTPSNIICCLFERQALVLHVLLGDLFITYYIPVIMHED